MHRTLYIILLTFLTLLTSCSLDQCSETITYVKATAIYADLDLVRIDDIVSPSRDINSPGKIYVSEDLLLIGEKSEGIHVFDNRDPAHPVALSFLSIPGNYEMFVEDGYVYANAYYDMLKIDISDIDNIHIASRLKEAFSVIVRNVDDRALIGFKKETITEESDCNSSFIDGESYYFDDQGVLLDQSAIPTSFVSNGSTIGTANKMAIVDNELFIINDYSMIAFDISDDRIVHSNSHSDKYYIGANLETIYALDKVLFIGTQDGMSIHTVTDRSVEFNGFFFHSTGCDPVLPLKSGVAYVTLRSGNECPGDINSLNVVDINTITNPILLQQIQMKSPYGMSIIADKLYVGEGENGLRIFDASNGRSLSEIDRITDVSAYDVIPHPEDEHILLIASSDGLTQYHLNDNGDLETLSFIGF